MDVEIINNISSLKVEDIPELSKKTLEQYIQICADAYYNTETPLVSDVIYDLMVDRLKSLDPNSKILSQIGYAETSNGVKLPYHMGSMDKIKTEDEISEWKKQFRTTEKFIISNKLDGISCMIHYNNRKFTLYTRGNGDYGRDITYLLKYIKFGIPDKFPRNIGEIAIRGELIISKEDFEDFADIMANSRNMASGIVLQKQKNINKERTSVLDFVAYEVILPELSPLDQLKTLHKWGFNVVNYKVIEYSNLSFEAIDNEFDKQKDSYQYEIDGLVVTHNKIHDIVEEGNPYYSFAYKKSLSKKTTVTYVEWTASKDGILVPVVVYKPIFLSGATLSRAQGFHAKFIEKNKIGPGAEILVVRSGDTIPYILSVTKKGKAPYLPEDLDYNWTSTGVNIVLSEPEKNIDVNLKRLLRFMTSLGIKNISNGVLAALYNEGYTDIFSIMKMKPKDLENVEGFGKVSAKKICDSIKEAMNTVDMLKLMVASNIFKRGFGVRKLKKILTEYPEIVFQYDKHQMYDKWLSAIITNIDGFDYTTASQFLNNLPEFQNFYKKFNKIYPVKNFNDIVKNTNKSRQKFANEVVVFSGVRKPDWEIFIEENGGKISSGVSKNTTLLVVKDKNAAHAKILKAKELKIRIIEEEEFIEQYNP